MWWGLMMTADHAGIRSLFGGWNAERRKFKENIMRIKSWHSISVVIATCIFQQAIVEACKIASVCTEHGRL
jgi:hypothetical protein